MENSDMETIRLIQKNDGVKEKILFFVISGVEKETNKQCIVIHRFSKSKFEEKQREDEGHGHHHGGEDEEGIPIPEDPNPCQVKKIYLSDNNISEDDEEGSKKVSCYPTHARTWIQYSNSIFYWDVSHKD